MDCQASMMLDCQKDLNPLLVRATVCGLIYWLAQDSTGVDNQSNDARKKVFQLGFALCVAVLFLHLLNHLPTCREVRGRGKLIYEVPLAKRGGVSNLPSAMQLVWGMGHFVNEVLRQLFLFVFAVITSERAICYYSPCLV